MNKKYILFGLITICSISFMSCSQKDEKQITKKEAALSAIYNRKSVRSFIKDRPVSDEDVQALIKAGMSAPSGKDTRPWEFVIINDRSILDKMSEELPTAKMLSQAPMAIVVCGDTIRSSYWYLDCSAATENILLAAEAMELGGVWTAAYPYRDRMATVIKHTNMPAQVLPLAVIPIGYPMGNHSVKYKYDEKKIHMNKW
ncbi:MAG TPA: nitroreductase family protein [Dysgonomonas sp.]|uniref:nitroreductase family protein n=2 Tax=unclassified Dysgonomonas TaxID=2630389 RepID=UPI002C2B9DA9|nr:nitroreductase family protein [Dysgonomonas sp.]HML63380.1 nitroreductase family protein [Dysgonomonas sp.]